jgi:hypothetical protein
MQGTIDAADAQHGEGAVHLGRVGIFRGLLGAVSVDGDDKPGRHRSQQMDIGRIARRQDGRPQGGAGTLRLADHQHPVGQSRWFRGQGGAD